MNNSIKAFNLTTIFSLLLTLIIFYGSGCFDLKSYDNMEKVNLINADKIKIFTERQFGFFNYPYSGVDIQYQYVAGKKIYIGNKIAPGYPHWSGSRKARNYANNLINKGVVYVNKDDPNIAYLVSINELKNIKTTTGLPIYLLFIQFIIMLFIREKIRKIDGYKIANINLSRFISVLIDSYSVAYICTLLLFVYYLFNPIKLWLSINIVIVIVFLCVSCFLYLTLFYERTLGQVTTGLYCVDLTSKKQPSLKQLIIRRLVILVSFGTSFLSKIFNNNNIYLHDKLSNTSIMALKKVDEDFYQFDYLVKTSETQIDKKPTIGDHILYGILAIVSIAFFLFVGFMVFISI